MGFCLEKREIFIMPWQVMMPEKIHIRTKQLLMKQIEGD